MMMFEQTLEFDPMKTILSFCIVMMNQNLLIEKNVSPN